MASLKITEPKATSFTTKVTVPMQKRIITFASTDISYWEKKFIEQRDNAPDEETKENFNICRDLIKWAETCGGSLDFVSNPENGVEFTFTFTDIDNLICFVKNLTIN